MDFFLMCGLPNAGKSTRAKQLSKDTGAVIVSTDEMTVELFRVGFSFAEIWKEIFIKIKALLESGNSVILDHTALTKAERKALLGICCQDVRKICIFVNTPVEVIEKRGVVQMEDLSEQPTIDEGFDEIIVIQ